MTRRYDSIFCPVCNRIRFHPGRHRCPPFWLCGVPDDEEEDFVSVRAYTAREAAEVFVAENDVDHGYIYASGFEDAVVVLVDGERETFHLHSSQEWHAMEAITHGSV